MRGLRGDPKGLKANVKTMAATAEAVGVPLLRIHHHHLLPKSYYLSQISSLLPPKNLVAAVPVLAAKTTPPYLFGLAFPPSALSTVSHSLHRLSQSNLQFLLGFPLRPLSSWMLPSFAIGSEETKASARHCTVGIEPRISNERIILLDTQPFIEELNYPMSEDCAGGNTRVLVNGRELHQRDLKLLGKRGLPTDRDRSYIIEMSGRVLDEVSSEKLHSLGKLAPTVEKVKHGFGMETPRAAT